MKHEALAIRHPNALKAQIKQSRMRIDIIGDVYHEREDQSPHNDTVGCIQGM